MMVCLVVVVLLQRRICPVCLEFGTIRTIRSTVVVTAEVKVKRKSDRIEATI